MPPKTALKMGCLFVTILALFIATHAIAAVIANGSSVGGYLSSSIPTETHTFVGQAGQQGVVAVSGDVSSGEFIEVYNPSGSLLETTGEKEFVELPESGTYTIVVRRQQWYGSGSYEVHVALAPGANEHGVVRNGGTSTGRIDSDGEIDSFTFNGTAGSQGVVAISGDVVGGEFLYIFNPDGTRLGYTHAQLYVTLPQTGTYTLVAASFQPRGIGNYAVHVALAPGANEYGLVGNGGSKSARIDQDGEIDSFTFNGSAGSEGVIAISGDVVGGEFMRIFNPDGTKLKDTYAQLFVTLPQTGTYTIVARSFQSTGTGDYAVHVALAPGANEYGVIANGGVVSGVIDADGEIDSFTFYGETGDTGDITINGNVGGGEYLRVFKPDGTLLTTSYNGTAAQLSLQQTGVYTVVASSFQSTGTGIYSIALNLEHGPLSYVALGDSYSSGEGVFLFRGDFGTDWGPDSIGVAGIDLIPLVGGCNRSYSAYSAFIRTPDNPLPIEQRNDTSFDFHACTGAETKNIQADGEGQFEEPPQAVASQVNASNDLLTITVGGNDAFFGHLLRYCMVHDHCHDLKPFDPYSNVTLGDLYMLWIPVVKQRLIDTFSELKSKAVNATIVAIDYPLVVGGNECERAQIASDMKLSTAEQAWMREANHALNQAVHEAAAAVGIHSVSVEQHFDGHGVCGDKDDWIFGTWHFWPKGMFHPTHRGQFEYARVVNAYLRSISTGWGAGYFDTGLPRNPAPVSSGLKLTQSNMNTLPRFGELTLAYESAPNSCNGVETVIVPGQRYTVYASGFAPNEAVTLTLYAGSQRIALGTLNAGANGDMQSVLQIPGAITATSRSVIEAFGAGNNGQGLLLTASLDMSDSMTGDTDGDGIPDACDNCASLSNANQADSDLDGIGDVCDLCPADALNDEDQDSLCRAVDSCPLDADNDVDGDGLCAEIDNCPTRSNVDQLDTDLDLRGNLCDLDDDNDGLLDLHETGTGVYVSPEDTGTNPLLADSDDDGVNDGVEIANRTNPNGAGTLYSSKAINVLIQMLLDGHAEQP